MARQKKNSPGDSTRDTSQERADCMLDIRRSINPQILHHEEMIDRLRLVLSEMHEGIIITDTKNTVEWINRKACQFLEVEYENAIGKPIKAFHKDRFVKDTKKFFDTFGSSELEFLEFEVEIHNRIINFRISPLHSKGQYYGIVRVLRDITQNRRAQEQVRLLAQAVNAAAEAIYIIDPSKSIHYVNPAFSRITGYDRSESIGKGLSLLRSDQHDESFYRNLWDTLRGGEPWSGRIVNRKKDGSLYTSDCTISPVLDEGGDIRYFVAVEKDITRELEIETQLLHSQKMEFVGRLTGGIAHDFNNMLTAIIGNSHLLLEEMDDEDPLRPEASAILKASLSAAGFIRQLLTFSRRQRGEVRKINLNYVLGEMEPLLKRLASENTRFEFRLGEKLDSTLADQGQIEQIIANLTVNARDAMSSGGSITFETSNLMVREQETGVFSNVKPGKYVQLICTDQGVGISNAYLDKIFEPFFTTKERGKGTGLGLSIVYGIVQKYGGAIRVFSRPGKGTTFRIIFPSVATGEELKPESRNRRARGGAETILLVEDEEVVRNFAVRVLKRLGYRVFDCETCDEALEVYRREGTEIDLIITDYVLADQSGAGLVDEIARITKKDRRPGIIFISGYPDFQAMSVPPGDSNAVFLEKPFTPDDLAHKIRDVLDGTVGM